ncbi:hypothetical protein [Mangrovivirga cuniculi]|uniref:Uncharacterized protein n=1 Tax=Mangrovivirga cuniculi TaxID=2715131 RepID=A0A4D7K781_9BACT|nr:hypothetical protein [Mangrovivirga cuniculi]QCK16564.1 hypothetical protein DCC35_18435 [Mangrovivirga cuniculi]
MKRFLKKIKLIDHLRTELNIEKNEFISRMRSNIDEGSSGAFSDFFDIFSSSKNEFKGEVDEAGFKIKRRRRFFDTYNNFAVAKGTFNQKENHLLINIEINGFKRIMMPFYIIGPSIYIFFIINIFLINDNPSLTIGAFVPFVLIHAVFMMGIPYLMMRRSTKKLKYDLERELYYLTK